MNAMILAAGLGTRLRPLTEQTPKPLLPVGGQPLIVWALALLRRHGVREVVVNLHHLGEQIEQALGDGSAWGLRITYSREPVILGTGGGLKQAEPLFGGDDFLVVNGDTIMDVDLTALIARHRAEQAVATMVLRDDPDTARWGPVTLDVHDRVMTINGRGRLGTDPTRTTMFAGAHIVSSRLLRDVPPRRDSSIIDAYVAVLAAGGRVAGFRMGGYWSDVGTPERYAQVQRDAEAGLVRFPA